MMVPVYACLEKIQAEENNAVLWDMPPRNHEQVRRSPSAGGCSYKVFATYLMNVCPYLIEPIVAVKAGLFPGTSILPWWRKREERECRVKYEQGSHWNWSRALHYKVRAGLIRSSYSICSGKESTLWCSVAYKNVIGARRGLRRVSLSSVKACPRILL